MATVFVPSLLRELTDGASRVKAEGRNLRDLLDHLDALYPGFKARLTEEDGRLRPEIVAAINGETEHMGMLEPLDEETEVHFIPAIGGGR